MAKKCTERGIIATIVGMKIRKEREIILKFAPFPYRYLIGEYDSILDRNQLIKETQLSENGSYSILAQSSHMSIYEEREMVYSEIFSFSKNFQKANCN